MNLRPYFLAAATGAALIATSTIAVAEKDSYSAKSAEKLGKALAGRTAGQPVSCISNTRGSDMTVIDDYTILFKEGGTIYVQKPHGGCYGLGNGNYSLVTRIAGSNRLCSGQIGELVDRVSGYGYGSCVFGEFVPYRKAS
ncbi:MAG TPA: hypothetical protein VL336_04255 [Sphingomicrobium sp.]|jgi:hypothetical protein|nr:hypothetical protein [Sphingomicrobium sp.]